MKGTRAALRYAKAILSLAKDKNSAEAVNEDFITIQKTVEASRDLKHLISSPVVKESMKKKVLLEVFKDLNGVTKGSIDLLLENGRINILDIVSKQYTILYNHSNNIKEAIVTTAIPLDAELEQKVMAKVKEITGESATLKNVVDESIIGGFILRVGDKQYDASIANNFMRLRRKLEDKTYISKL